MHSPEDATESSLQSDNDGPEDGNVGCSWDGTVGQQCRVRDLVAICECLLKVTRRHFATSMFTKTSPDSPVVGSTRPDVDKGWMTTWFLEHQDIDPPDILRDEGGKGLKPAKRRSSSSLKYIEQTRAEGEADKSEQGSDPSLRRENVAEARVDVSRNIDASPGDEDREAYDVGGSV